MQGLIAYISNRGGADDLWLYNPQTGNNRVLTQGLATENSIPYWSCDAGLIAFVGISNVVFVVDIFTNQVMRIDQLEPHSFLAWSPNSRKLVYTKSGKIYIYDVTTHQFVVLERPGATEAQLFPGEREILYTADNQLIRERLDASGVKKIIAQNGPFHDVRLAPDGCFVFYTTPGVSVSLIRTIDLNTSTIYEIPGGPLGKNYYPDWAPDSLKLAYSATDYQEYYFSLIRVSGRRGENDRTLAYADCFGSPVSWSPDSIKLAYLAGCAEMERASQIWIIDLRNPVPKLAVEAGRIVSLQWSPLRGSCK